MNQCNEPDHGAINAERAESRGLRKAWVELDDKRQDLEKQLSTITAQRDRLAEEIENLKASGIHTCHDQCKRPMCVMRRERDRLQNELNELKEDRDAWKSEALIMDARLRGVKHPNDNGIFSPDEVIPKLERELATVAEQRDRLAAIARELTTMIRINVMVGRFAECSVEQIDEHLKPWNEKIAAVKGDQP